MAPTGYLIRLELKKYLGGPVEDARTFFVLPDPEGKPVDADSPDKAFDVANQAVRESTRFPVVEEAGQRKVSVEDLRALRNSLLLEKDGWKCYGLRL